MESHREKIKNYILENFLFTNDLNAVEDDTSFLRAGIVDSTGILEIISFIEEEYQIQVQDDEVVPENLDSINLISSFIEKKMSEKGVKLN